MVVPFNNGPHEAGWNSEELVISKVLYKGF